jgi:hypothetical protein
MDNLEKELRPETKCPQEGKITNIPYGPKRYIQKQEMRRRRR